MSTADPREPQTGPPSGQSPTTADPLLTELMRSATAHLAPVGPLLTELGGLFAA